MNAVNRTIVGIGFWSALIILPVMICVRVYEIVARNVFNTSSPLPQYLEWDLFLLLVFLTLGYAYVRGAHVRVDVIRDRLKPVIRNRIELMGLLLLIAPFVLVVIWFGIPFAIESFEMGEKAALTLGAPGRWIMKGAMSFGLILLLLAAVVAAVRTLAQRLDKE